jgi:hypothetical protein
MGRTLATYTDRVRSILGGVGSSTLSDADVEGHIYAAVRRFSTEVPRLAYSDYAGNSSASSFALPVGWQQGFSEIAGVEYPQGNNPPLGLDDQELNLYPATGEPTTLLLSSTVPQTGQTARLYYTQAWPLPDSSTTTDVIPDVGYEPLCQLAASFAAEQLAARAANSTHPTGGSDFANVNPEEQNWREVASACLKRFDAFIGGGDQAGPAFGWESWDVRSNFEYQSGGLYLFRAHNRKIQ